MEHIWMEKKQIIANIEHKKKKQQKKTAVLFHRTH